MTKKQKALLIEGKIDWEHFKLIKTFTKHLMVKYYSIKKMMAMGICKRDSENKQRFDWMLEMIMVGGILW